MSCIAKACALGLSVSFAFGAAAFAVGDGTDDPTSLSSKQLAALVAVIDEKRAKLGVRGLDWTARAVRDERRAARVVEYEGMLQVSFRPERSEVRGGGETYVVDPARMKVVEYLQER